MLGIDIANVSVTGKAVISSHSPEDREAGREVSEGCVMKRLLRTTLLFMS